MEAVAAVGLTASIVELLRFTIMVATQSKKLYQSSSGATVDTNNTEIVAKTIQEYLERQRGWAAAGGQSISDTLKELHDACQSCAEQLLRIVQKSKVDANNKPWMSIKTSVYAVAKRSELQELRNRLVELHHLAHNFNRSNEMCVICSKELCI